MSKHHHNPGIGGRDYVSSGIEAERRIKAGWKQRLCKICRLIYVWVRPRK